MQSGDLHLISTRTSQHLVCLQISKIVSNIPNLDFLNLSFNPLAGVALGPNRGEAFSHVRRLILNNTQVSWDTVFDLTRDMPE